MLRFMFSIGMLLTLVATLGCGGVPSGPPTATASGLINLQGAPLGGAVVTFVSAEHQFSVAATTDETGAYSLEAAVGPNKITVSKMEGGGDLGGSNEEDGLDQGQLEAGVLAASPDTNAGVRLPKQLVPEKYTSPDTSDLMKDVPQGGGSDFNFDLQG